MNVRSSIRPVLRRPSAEVRRLAREEAGVALMLTLAVFLLLYVLCCGVFATGEIIRQRIQLQNACDAAAYSAAVVQADALSRMAVVNRAMAWTYIQLCREQMDYIVFSWLNLTSERFWWDWNNKAKEGDIDDFQHFHFRGYGIPSDPAAARSAVAGFGLYDLYQRHDRAYYTGYGATNPDEHDVRLNWRDIVDMDEIDGALKEISDGSGGRQKWKEGMEENMRYLKAAILGLNGTLEVINAAMMKSVPATAQYVLYQNLPKGEQGEVEESTAKDFYWTVVGGVGGIPLAYTGEVAGSDPMGSYFEGLFNTEEDEIQFLQMADGLPGQKAGAPGWMKDEHRPVVLSDYFGTPGQPVQSGFGKTRYVAGGLDQWYVRGPSEEAMDPRPAVPKQFLKDPPGGIQRVYKHTNREEGEVLKHFLRPNHVFQTGATGLPKGMSMDMNQFDKFMNPKGLAQSLLGSRGTIARRVYDFNKRKSGGLVRGSSGWRFANNQADMIMGLLNGVNGIGSFSWPAGLGGSISGILGQLAGCGSTFSDLLKAIANGDIPPSNEHVLRRYPEQCRNVNEATALVSEYEWASAYWLCPWVRVPTMFGTITIEFGHVRVPFSELKGCGDGKTEGHGYHFWLSEQVKILREGHVPRDKYRSCFIGFDPTANMDLNTFLKGYARIYGDDVEIFNEVGYVGQVARPWILGKSFFSGDGTILVGLARRQKNPFMRMLSWGSTRNGERPSLYEPFSPQPGRDRFLVGLSAARAAWAPRPDRPVTGMESMNAVEGQRAPGNYEPRWDEVTDHKFEIEGGGIGGARAGCVCGKMTTHDRLKRMWNLSQTDWDATLLPLRHAYCEHSPYDSYRNLTDGSFWEFDDLERNGVAKMAGILTGPDVKWKNGAELLKGQAPSQWNGRGGKIPAALSTSDILAFPKATDVPSEDPGSPYLMFLFRRLL